MQGCWITDAGRRVVAGAVAAVVKVAQPGAPPGAPLPRAPSPNRKQTHHVIGESIFDGQ